MADDWAYLVTASDWAEAAVISSVLAAEGIPVRTVTASVGGMYPARIGPLAEVKVFVRECMLARAREALAAGRAGREEGSEQDGEGEQ